MQARMKHPALVIPESRQALLAFHETTHVPGLPEATRELVNLRASQINGCSVCVVLHGTALRKEGESDERLVSVAAWRDAPYFSDAERAALALAESVTRVADRGDVVPDDVWAEAARHYDEHGLCALLIAITSVNVWNRLNAATRQVAGAWTP